LTATATATATEWRNGEVHSAEGQVMLSFQKLDVYRCAIEFLLSTGLAQNLPKGHAGLAEQLRRAALVAMLTKLCR
jgi:hypothetical protein